MTELLTTEERQFLNLDSKSTPKQVLDRINFHYTLYSDTRYAPDHREERLTKIQTIAEKLGVRPMSFQPPVAKYCGNHYLAPTSVNGTPNECFRQGALLGDKHGK